MRLSAKDRSMLILVASAIILVWFIGSVVFNIFYSTKYDNVDLKKIVTNEQENWFNVTHPLTLDELKERVILVYFWSGSCINCFEAMPKIKELQNEFGSKLVVIGVHSPMFAGEGDYVAVKKAVLRHDITNPVINDQNLRIMNNFDLKEWPSFLVINPYGVVSKKFVGKNQVLKLAEYVSKQIAKYKFQISRNALPILLEKNNLIGNVLSYPTKLAYANNFSHKTRQIPAIFIANTGQNTINITTITGESLLKIGSDKAGMADGSYEVATFNAPQGLLYADNKLYVADTGNHAIRVVNFKENKVQTLIGNGVRGEVIDEGDNDVKAISLSSPTDLEFFPDENNLVISNSGTNQILLYNINEQDISIFAGNGQQGIDDGKFPNNSLAQTSDMAVYNDKLYFVDSASSSLRYANEDGEIKTLVKSLDGVKQNLSSNSSSTDNKKSSILQSPKGLVVDDTGVYISDSLNNRLKKYDFSSAQIRDLVGSNRGEELGNKTNFDEPNGIISVLDRFYVADTNNNRIVMVSRSSFDSELLNVMPALKLQKEGFLQYLPNLETSNEINLKAQSDITFALEVEKGWKINDQGPSFLNVLLYDDKTIQADLIANFDWNIIKDKIFTLPKFEAGKNYILQGKFYYCKDSKNALCYIKSYEQKIKVKSDETATNILLKLGK